MKDAGMEQEDLDEESEEIELKETEPPFLAGTTSKGVNLSPIRIS